MTRRLILLVEDNPDDELLTKDALRRSGISADLAVARDGAEALEFIAGAAPVEHIGLTDSPQLILLDLKLPRVSGLEVLRRIRANPATKLRPVVILTSSAEESDLVQAYENGANSYIQKPIELERFADLMKTLGLYWLSFNQVPETQ